MSIPVPASSAPAPPPTVFATPETSTTSTSAPPIPADNAFPPTVVIPATPVGLNHVELSAGVTPAMAVRLGLLRRLWAATVQMQGPRRKRLAFLSVVGFGELVALIVILALTYHDTCDRPLAPYLVMVCVRLVVQFPLSYWLSINVRPGSRATPEQRDAWERNRLVGNFKIDRRVKLFNDLIAMLSLVLFFCGNYWLISERTCHETAPVLYKTALAALILSWLWTAEIILYAVLILFFLPFFLIGARWFGLGAPKHEIGPLSKPDIDKLPKRIFMQVSSFRLAGIIPSPDDPPLSASSSSPSHAGMTPPETAAEQQLSSPDLPKPAASSTVSPVSSTKKKQWWRLWRDSASVGRDGSRSPLGGARKDVEGGGSASEEGFVPFPTGLVGIKLPASQNSCSICLCEYDPPPLLSAPQAEREAWKPEEEVLALLPCDHAFHKVCLADWLVVSGRCPLCQRPVNEPKQKGKMAARVRTNPNAATTAPPTGVVAGPAAAYAGAVV
ncbi:hypothetical protein JCM11641_004380 [Rhodosporidiobolus odoratus]